MFGKWFDKKKNSTGMLEIDDELIEKCSVYYIPCDAIRPNAMRSRYDFDEDKLVKLACSIKHYGIIEPIIVRETDVDDSYDYEIVSGERRLRAAKLAGLSLIPSIILDVEQEISAEMSIIENIHSEPLNYFEHAVALQRLKEHYQDDFCDVSSRLGLSEHQMSKKLKLLELSYNERQILLNMNVSEDNALGIAQITDKAQRHMLIESICGEGLNEDAIISRLELINQSNARSNCDLELPRDVSSAIKGIISKINFLNRYKKRADVKLSRSIDCITLNISIKL